MTPSYKIAELKGVISRWQERAEAAEKRVAELEKEQDEHDSQISTMEGKFNLAKRALDSKAERCSKAESELSRRDAAAGVPVAWVTMQKSFCDDERTVITNKIEADKYSAQCYELTPLCEATPPKEFVVKLKGDLKVNKSAHRSHRDYAEGYNDRAEIDRAAIKAAGGSIADE